MSVFCGGIYLVLLMLLTPTGYPQANAPDALGLKPAEVPADCKPVDGYFPVDIQTAILWDKTDLYKRIMPDPTAKKALSLDCDGEKGTIYYFQFSSASQRKSAGEFIKPLLWGGPGPTAEHPEVVLEAEDVLVVVSFRKASKPLLAALQKGKWLLVPSGGAQSSVTEADRQRALDSFEKGRQAYSRRELAQAEKYFHDAIQADPGSVFAWIYLGNSLFVQERFNEAVAPYEEAKELEQSAHSLDQTQRRILNDQLGMSYGISGQLEKSRDLFENAIQQDPEYALYHYNLACAHAEMGNLDKTLAALAGAFKYRQNVLPGESLPDPRKDSSFRRYLKDERFQKLLKDNGY
jgi:Tfp pilus assembly protein PilF